MKFYLNTQTGNLSSAGPNGQALRRIDAKQRDDLFIEIFPSTALEGGATGLLAAKATYDGELCTIDVAWEAPQTSEAGYVFELPLYTEAIETALSYAEASITLKAEVRWVNGGKKRRTQTFDLVIARAIYLEEDALPKPASAPGLFHLSSPDGSQWEVTITDDGQIERTKLS